MKLDKPLGYVEQENKKQYPLNIQKPFAYEDWKYINTTRKYIYMVLNRFSWLNKKNN